MALRRFHQFRLSTALAATLIIGVGLAAIPYWFGSYEQFVATVLRRPVKRKPTWTDTIFPVGNKRTRAFLAWAANQYAMFGKGDLDSNGDLVSFSVNPCWPTSDADLQEISKLKTLRSLTLSAEKVTDAGLAYLDGMPALQRISFCETERISDAALARLKARQPKLAMHFDYPTRQLPK